MNFSHYSVLFDACMEMLDIKPDGVYIDCTAGGGGHSTGIAERLVSGRLFSLDQDMDAIRACTERLSPYADRVTLVHSNFSSVKEMVGQYGVSEIDGALIDLGVSSYQLDNAERGFSYRQDAPLDMRMDREQTFSAFHVVNEYDETELMRVLYEYGEERFAPQIARAILKVRACAPIRTTGELASVIKAAIPEKARSTGHHPAKKSFQAIRIEVNGELRIIAPTLMQLVDMLKPGGRLAVSTFQSLEDRIVKQTFASLAKGCVCPPDFPVCVCGRKAVLSLVNRKPIEPSVRELAENPRSRSAKLRVVEKK